MSDKEFMRPREAAEYIGRSVDVLQAWRSQRRRGLEVGPVFHGPHGRPIYLVSDLRAFLLGETCRRGSESPSLTGESTS